MLLTDTMRRSYSMWRKFENEHLDEARVFYVGLTRALQHLHLIHPMFSRGLSNPSIIVIATCLVVALQKLAPIKYRHKHNSHRRGLLICQK